jgi:hypothetical protein
LSRVSRVIPRLRLATGAAVLLLAEVLVPLLATAPAGAAALDTTTTVTSNTNSTVFGQNITFTATVAPASPPGSTPTGTAAFKDNGTLISGCGARPLNSGTTTCSTTSLTAGTHAISAVYTPDTQGALVYNTSTGSKNQTVGKANTATTVTGAPNPSLPNVTVTFTATVAPSSATPTPPTGTVAFKDGTTTITGCATSLVATNGANQTATCTTSFSAAQRGTRTITAVYSGDTNFNTSTSAGYPQEVGAVASTTTLTSDTNPSVFGQSVTLTATVTSAQPGTPTGTVNFKDGANSVTGCSAVALDPSAVATCTTSALAAATHSLSAVYSGNTDFTTSTGTLSQVVNKAATTTVLTTNTPTVFGQAAVLTATVTPTAPGAGVPQGTVAFTDGATTLCAAQPVNDNDLKATCSITSLAVGSHTLTAVYAGNSSFSTSQGGASHTVNKAATSTSLISSQNPSVTGQAVTFTATVQPTAPGAGPPAGTVTFNDGATAKCTNVALDGSGQATCALASLTVATHPITAVYSGNGSFLTSTSSAVDQVVNKAATTTALASSKTPSEFGESVTITATVTATAPGTGTPSGTVTFKDGGADITGCTAVALANVPATAACTKTDLTIATHHLTAVYSGDTAYNTSTSSQFDQVVNQHATSTALGASPASPSHFGESVTFTATVSAVTSGVATPNGTVTFKDGANAITGCTSKTLTTGQATCATSALAVGAHTISAVYNADATNGDYGTSTGSASYTVDKDVTTTVVTSSANPSVKGEEVTLTATVSSTASGTPTGTVVFKAGGTTITGCEAVALASGHADCTTSTLPVAANAINAAYSGDGTFAASDGGITQTVNKAATTTALATSGTPTVKGQLVTFTATVATTAPGTGTAAGTVSFLDTTTSATLCAAATLDVNGVATCPVSSLAVGSHSVTATYAGNASYLGSTSSAVSQVVNKADTSTVVASSAPDGALVNQSITFTATVSVTAPGAGTPTGTVDFKSDGTSITGCNARPLAANGTATCSTSALSRATHTITAVYSGDTSFNTSTSPGISQVVGTAGSTTALASSSNPSVATEPVTLTATVSSAAPGTPSGTVAFKQDGTTITGCGTKAIDVSGVATCAVSGLVTGSYAMTAVYSGDNNFRTSTGALTQTVGQAASTTAVTSAANPSVVGQSVTYTATVAAAAPATGTPTGTVTFTEGATTLCLNVALSSGTATCTPSARTLGSHDLTATYSGDDNYATSSGSLTQVVNQAATTTALASSPNPSVVGQAVTFTATVTATAPGSGTPTGTVNFKDGATTITGCGAQALSAGVATCTTSTLSKTTHSVTAVSSGDANFTGSTSSAVSQVVNQADTSTAVASSANPSVNGQVVTFTATVSVTAPGAGTPTGTVTFKDSATAVCSNVPVDNGQAVCATNALSVATHQMAAVYNGDSNFAGSTSSGLAQVVNKADTSVAVTSSANPSASGDSVTFTATVTADAPGSGTPTGTVDFANGATTLCDNAALTNGVATCTTSALPTGSRTITAAYGGDGGFNSSSGQMTQSVVNNASATTLTSSQNPSVSGQPVTFTATVALSGAGSGTPGGTVQFKDGSTTITGCSASALSAGVATCTTSALAVATHSVTAVYSGDNQFGQSTSAALSQVVNKAASSTTLGSAPNPSTWGQSVTFTATVALTGPGAGTPGGSVDFKDGASSIAGCSAQPVSSGTATCITTALSAATHSVTAVYSGDSTFNTSTSSALSQVVNKAATSSALGSSKTTTVSREPVTFTATIAVTAPGTGTPAGTVNFKDGASSISGCSAVSVASNQAVCSAPSLTVGTHSITAVYSGDASTLTSTSSAVTQTVDKATTSTALASSANPAASGSGVTFTATVSVTAPGGGGPTGTVSFKDAGSTICTSAVSSGKATCSTSSLAAGSHAITAAYSGDGSLLGSTSSALSQSIAAPARSGYWMVTRGGVVYGFGNAASLGNAPTSTAVDIEPTKAFDGYWVVDEAGHVFAFNAPFKGGVQAGQLQAGEIVTSISATLSGQGYWLFTDRGRVLTFGDAVHRGDMSGVALNGPVLGSVATPSGLGYYMVASDGGVFAFGDAQFRGSMGGQPLNGAVQSLVPDGDNDGYWLVAVDGGVFAFSAGFHGSMGGQPLNKPITGMVRYGDGYLMVAEDGGIFNFSTKPFAGSLGSSPPATPVVSVAVLDA